jgi:hypothetical protein
MTTREEMAVLDADYRSKIAQMDGNLQAERRRRVCCFCASMHWVNARLTSVG